MIDAVKIELDSSEQGYSPGWFKAPTVDLTVWKPRTLIVWKLNPITHKPQAQRWRSFEHKNTGLDIRGPAQFGPQTLEFSYSRILFPSNGCLVRRQEQIDQAGEQIGKLLSQVSPFSCFSISRVLRIELTWQFLGAPCEWVTLFSLLKHPRIEGTPISWRSEYLPADVCINADTGSFLRQSPIAVSYCPTSVTWHGELLRIKLYDKVAQMRLCGRMTPVMRLEFTLSGRLASGLVEDGRLVFGRLYRRYRELSGGFRDLQCSRSAYGSSIDFVLSLRARGLIPEHEYNLFMSAQSRATRHRYRTRARSIRDVWEAVPGVIARLPEGTPPGEAESPDVVAPPRQGARA